MDVKDTLERCEYHLERMKELYPKEEYFKKELNAFLPCVQSIPEHLLNDYQIKFGLNILDKEHLVEKFNTVAKRQNNLDAMTFYSWWKAEVDKLRKDAIGKVVLNKRDLTIHRKTIKPDLAKHEITDRINIIDTVTVIKRDAKGKIYEISESPPEPKPTPIPSESRTDRYFKEIPEKTVIDVCQIIYALMSDLVKKAEIKFP